MKQVTLKVSNCSVAQWSTLLLELNIMTKSWAKFGPTIELQAPSIKLDKSSKIGYCRSQGQARDGQAIDICRGPLMGPRNSAAETLQQRGRYARHEKSPARARNGSCRVMVSKLKNKKDLKLTSSQAYFFSFLWVGGPKGHKHTICCVNHFLREKIVLVITMGKYTIPLCKLKRKKIKKIIQKKMICF